MLCIELKCEKTENTVSLYADDIIIFDPMVRIPGILSIPKNFFFNSGYKRNTHKSKLFLAIVCIAKL